MNNYIGEIAAMGTTVCWTFTSTAFTISSKYVGAGVVNRLRLVMAVIYLSLAHLLIYGQLLPFSAEPYRWGWLGASGIVGLVFGDALLFQAYVFVGTHIAMLIMSIVPIISVLMAWIFLGEALSFVKIGAIIITVIGITMVVLQPRNEKEDSEKTLNRRNYKLGILCAIGGAFGQAFGLIIAKKGLGGDFSGLSATLIRVLTGTIVLWIFTALRGQTTFVVSKLKHRKAALFMTGAAFGGPFLGIWLSMVAIKWTYIGIASTLMALPPILLLPVTRWVFKEKIALLSIIGTVVAVAGVALIFLV